MRILYVGHLHPGQTSRMRMDVLRELGHEVIPVDAQTILGRASYLERQIRSRTHRGPAVSSLNEEILRQAREHRPDFMWADKQEYMRPETLLQLRAQGTRLLHYTPDPYFTLSWKRTSLTEASLPLYDYAVTAKSYEMEDYRCVSRHAIYMPLGFAEDVHRPLLPANRREHGRFSSDVGFIGGWEPRRERLLNLVAGTGCSLKIWGYAWDHLSGGTWTPRRHLRLRRLAGTEPFRVNKNERLAEAVQGGEVLGDQYAWSLTGARIGVGFLRKVCPDQHTTRTFEIPACGSMMLADRTDEHCEFFEEGREAEFFSSEEELLEKIRFYLAHEPAREKVARAGYERCFRSGYSYRERMSAVLARLT